MACGWMLGVATVAALLGGGALALDRHGVAVPVDLSGIAERVQADVETQVLEQLPKALAVLKGEVPERVVAQVKKRLDGGTVRIGELQIQVPPGIADEVVNKQVRATVTEVMDDMTRDMDGQALAKQLGARAADLVRRRLTAELAQAHLTVRPWRYISVPVILQPR